MNFDIQFIGVGSAFSKIHNNNNVLISIDDKKYLLDCGLKTPQALYDMGIEIEDIDGIIISHIHADHIGGLEEVGFMGKFVLNKKFKLYVPSDIKNDLWDKCLSGGMEDLVNGKATLETYFDIEEYDDLKEFYIGQLDILPIKTTHVKNEISKEKASYSFIFNSRIFYSSDMIFQPGLLEVINDHIETIFHDCQFFTSEEPVHASLDELETLSESIRSKIKLMHYGDNFKDFDERIKSLKMERVIQGQTFEF